MKKILVLAMAILAAAGCSKSPVLNITGGRVQGVSSGTPGVTVFKGIPYAAAPVDSLRWRTPMPVTPWEGVKVADTFGNIPWQDDLSQMDLYGKEFYSDGMPEMSEDCLYLNVWAPSKTLGDLEAGLPVAVWIHGGAFNHGYGSEITMDGSEWAKRGVILVTFNYRVGLFGYFTFGHLFQEPTTQRPGNFGMYDQLAALMWVKQNIMQFGGDPDNITLMGQSAGAISVQDFVCAKGLSALVSKAIMQSGGGISSEQQHRSLYFEQVVREGDAFCEFAQYDSLSQMRAVPAQELMAKYDEYVAQGGSLHLRPMLDFEMKGISFTSAATANKVADIPYMIGFTAKDGVQSGRDIDQFCASRNYYSGAPVYEYEFVRELPGDDAGAFHSAELWYMFGTLDRCWRPFTREDHALSEEMLDAWTNFAKFGDPCGETPSDYWPAFTKENPYRKIFDVK